MPTVVIVSDRNPPVVVVEDVEVNVYDSGNTANIFVHAMTFAGPDSTSYTHPELADASVLLMADSETQTIKTGDIIKAGDTVNWTNGNKFITGNWYRFLLKA